MKNVRYLPENVTFDDVFDILYNLYKVQFDRIKIYKLQDNEPYATNTLKFNYDDGKIISIRESEGQHLYRITNCKYGVEEIREDGKLIRNMVYSEKEEFGGKTIVKGTFDSDEACTCYRNEHYNRDEQLVDVQYNINGKRYHYSVLYDINGKIMSVSLWWCNAVISLEDMYMRFETDDDRLGIPVANRDGLRKISFCTKEDEEDIQYIITFKGGN